MVQNCDLIMAQGSNKAQKNGPKLFKNGSDMAQKGPKNNPN